MCVPAVIVSSTTTSNEAVIVAFACALATAALFASSDAPVSVNVCTVCPTLGLVSVVLLSSSVPVVVVPSAVYTSNASTPPACGTVKETTTSDVNSGTVNVTSTVITSWTLA